VMCRTIAESSESFQMLGRRLSFDQGLIDAAFRDLPRTILSWKENSGFF
jgi:hypothetical protein